MTALLNLVVPIIVLVWSVIAYRSWNKNKNFKKVFTHYLIPLCVCVYIYQVIQPSYLPKGKAPEMRRLPYAHVEYATEDRLKAPKLTEEERQERVDELLDWQKKTDKILAEPVK